MVMVHLPSIGVEDRKYLEVEDVSGTRTMWTQTLE